MAASRRLARHLEQLFGAEHLERLRIDLDEAAAAEGNESTAVTNMLSNMLEQIYGVLL